MLLKIVTYKKEKEKFEYHTHFTALQWSFFLKKENRTKRVEHTT